jgi:hypothetical protein
VKENEDEKNVDEFESNLTLRLLMLKRLSSIVLELRTISVVFILTLLMRASAEQKPSFPRSLNPLLPPLCIIDPKRSILRLSAVETHSEASARSYLLPMAISHPAKGKKKREMRGLHGGVRYTISRRHQLSRAKPHILQQILSIYELLGELETGAGYMRRVGGLLGQTLLLMVRAATVVGLWCYHSRRAAEE